MVESKLLSNMYFSIFKYLKYSSFIYHIQSLFSLSLFCVRKSKIYLLTIDRIEIYFFCSQQFIILYTKVFFHKLLIAMGKKSILCNNIITLDIIYVCTTYQIPRNRFHYIFFIKDRGCLNVPYAILRNMFFLGILSLVL